MYFAVLGKNKDLSIQELSLLNPKGINVFGSIVEIDNIGNNNFNKLGGITKYGKIILEKDFESELKGVSLLGTNEDKFGVYLKKLGLIRRYKLVEKGKTDLEIKEKGKEVIFLGNNKFGLVQGYQNIGLYEAIDFEKPSSGMNVGMMPSKLAHILLNIGVSNLLESSNFDKNDSISIYDPFVGFGTTGFISNYLGYNFIGSDIKVTSFKQNLNRWINQKYHNDSFKILEFKHDVTNSFQKNFLKNINLIVTEGWLGPVVFDNTSYKNLLRFKDRILDLCSNFLNNVYDFWPKIIIAITIPVYLKSDVDIVNGVVENALNIGYKYKIIGEPYARKGQNVGRQILILKKD